MKLCELTAAEGRWTPSAMGLPSENPPPLPRGARGGSAGRHFANRRKVAPGKASAEAFPARSRDNKGGRRRFWLAVIVLAACRPPDPTPLPKSTAKPAPSVPLTVCVLDDPPLAERVRRLAGEWAALNGKSFHVLSGELAAAKQGPLPAADLYLFPARQLAELVQRGTLQPLRQSLRDDAEFNLADVEPAIREGLMTYGQQIWGAPLAGTPWTLQRSTATGDVTGSKREASSLSPLPATWQEFDRQVAAGAADVDLAGRQGLALFLARAWSMTDAGRRPTALFDPETMRPQLTSPPMVRALAELCDLARRRVDGAGVRFAVRGEGARPDSPQATATGARVVPRQGPLPTAAEVYSPARENWIAVVDGEPLSILGDEGRLLSVGRQTRNAVAACQLCRWLSTGARLEEVAGRAEFQGWVRQSQRRERQRRASPAAAQAVAAYAAALQSETPLLAPRVPGVEEYLTALTAEVDRARAGKSTPAAALEAAAAEWDAITDRRGRDRQLRAYLRHLGLEAWSESP